MANLFEQRDRRVIPNWRSFRCTTKLSELSFAPQGLHTDKNIALSINDYSEAWKKDKSVAVAGDLISAAFVNGFEHNDEAKRAAGYIIKNPKKATDAQISLAKLFLGIAPIDHGQINTFEAEACLSTEKYYREIHRLRDLVNRFPYNPILYVELSRLYTILGLELKSIKNMRVALSLAPDNRFVLRAAARLFVHYDKVGFIHNVLRKSGLVGRDPWVTSAEIALATIREKRSPHIKTGIQMINSGNFTWHSLTELASSVGTVEYLSGSKKKAIGFLRKALQSPNDNTLAQVAWINSRDALLDIDPRTFNIQNKYEALALNDYFDKSYSSALDNCRGWFDDLPFSKHPIIFGAHIAGSLLNDYDESIRLLKIGLLSHPKDPQLINNIAYSYALGNKIIEAEEYLSRIGERSEMTTDAKICLIATRGLIKFRKKDTAGGNAYYQQAIGAAKSHGNNYLVWLAILNYARETVLSAAPEANSVEVLMTKVPDNPYFPDLVKLKKEVIGLLKLYNRSG